MQNLLPEHIINKIILYNSHPIADLLKKSDKFKLRKCWAEHKHGCPFDRGSADAYYRRRYNPHYIIDRVLDEKTNRYYDVRIERDEMTEDEINEYYLGFVNEDDRKFMTEHEYYLSERGLFDGYEIDFEGVYDY